MIRSMKILALVAAAVLAAPAAMAGWMSYGSFEPDVAEDATGGWMWAESPGVESQGKQVYFNAFGTMGMPLTLMPAINHNVGALETRFDATNQAFQAFLGVWQDCNGDGYVGAAETAAHSYRVELNLHDTTVCPEDTTSAQSHNDGVWVRELIPIGITRDATNSSGYEADNGIDTAVYLDDTAIVWGDAGFPGEDLESTGSGGSCPVNPLPRGTMQSTGGLLKYADCGVGVVGIFNGVVTTVDPENEQGLAFADPNNPNEPGHPLNQPTLGAEDSEERAFTVWDCEGAPLAEQEVVDPTGFVYEEPQTLYVYSVAPGLGPGSSIAGANNHTFEGLDNCDTSDDAGADTYFLEGDHEGASTTSKNAANWNFRFYRAASHPGYTQLEEDEDLGTPAVVIPSWGVPDLGLQALQPALGTYWTSFSWLIGATPNTPVRTGLGVDTDEPTASDLEPNPRTGGAPAYYSFYAYVGNAGGLGLVLPGGGATGTYANEWCNGADTGIKFGVDCDADNWNRNAADGSEQLVPSGTVKFAVPGTEYNLRDIDCYDSTFAGYEADCATLPLPAPATAQP